MMSFDYSRLSNPLPGSPLAIAEIGTAHGGDLQRGLDLIDAAADAGAHVAKVQVVFAQEILPPEAGLVPLPGGLTPLYEVFRSLEKPPEFYAALAERAAARGIGFLASPFGMKSVALLESIGVQAWKVASPELNHEPLIQRLASTGLPIIFSTGVAQPEDIRRALEIAAGPGNRDSMPSNASPRPAHTLLHCITSYPAPEDQANIRAIPVIAADYGVPVGLSDHSLDPVLLPALASAAGAVIVEKHITLSKTDGGLDDPVALIPDDFARMTSAMEHFSTAVPLETKPRHAPGTTADDKHHDPPGLIAAVDELAVEYGRERVEACLGSGVKTLAVAEKENYGRTNRSLHAVGALAGGTVITEENTALLRTEKVLRPGLPPRERHSAYGRRLRRDIASGDGILLEDLE